jgi:general secretion pathway protein G
MKKKRKVYPGFTLVELMVVLAIMGILTSIVAVNVFKQKGKASVKAAGISLKGVEQALILYQADNKQYPKTLQELVDKGFLKGKLKDPWDTKFNYSPIYYPQ